MQNYLPILGLIITKSRYLNVHAKSLNIAPDPIIEAGNKREPGMAAVGGEKKRRHSSEDVKSHTSAGSKGEAMRKSENIIKNTLRKLK